MFPECAQKGLNAVQGARKGVLERCECPGQVRDKVLEAQDVEHAGEVVAECHQAPFATYLVEAAKEKVPIAGAAFERAEGMLDDGGPTAHQVACA